MDGRMEEGREGGREGVSHCAPCKKVTARLKNYCRSNFVVRAYIEGFEYFDNETRYEMLIMQSYKNTLTLLNKEFVWAPDRCHCPRLKVNGEYVIMGTLVSDSNTRESRLQIDRSTFVRKYNRNNHRRLAKLQNTKLNCKRFT
ncbi:hypothetical protein LSAT2_013776 [Lamellibrachia satsuma]|nr:hypothetical protein LSAT2_013776 [Lamellibrachia satsuma]